MVLKWTSLKWTSLNRSPCQEGAENSLKGNRGRWCVSSEVPCWRGTGPVRSNTLSVMVTWHPREQTDRHTHYWKHYLPATSLAGDKKTEPLPCVAGVHCSAEDFHKFEYPDYFNCYTYKGAGRVSTSTIPGPQKGLSMILYGDFTSQINMPYEKDNPVANQQGTSHTLPVVREILTMLVNYD